MLEPLASRCQSSGGGAGLGALLSATWGFRLEEQRIKASAEKKRREKRFFYLAVVVCNEVHCMTWGTVYESLQAVVSMESLLLLVRSPLETFWVLII